MMSLIVGKAKMGKWNSLNWLILGMTRAMKQNIYGTEQQKEKLFLN
jgi:hypothetical protein